MSKGIIYKEWYKSRNLPSTPTLNRKHLQYIATRPGAAHNKGCSFGLWGKLPGMTEIDSINNLEIAKNTITAVSKEHTIYRAVFSVEAKDALKKGLYKRKEWEKVINAKIGILARERGWKEKDLCWVAGQHYAKGHPHVHVMYWDSSDEIRQEHTPKEAFEIMAEHVRAEFNKEIYREELTALRGEKKKEQTEIKLKLRALLKEANIAEALNLTHVSPQALDHLSVKLGELVATAPQSGSLKYAYMKGEYKEKLDAYITEVLQISDLSAELKKYDKAVIDLSKLYGNGAEQQQFELEKARKALYKDMGNAVLDTVRQFRKELSEDTVVERGDLQIVLQGTASVLIRSSPSYHQLLEQMPKERTPTGELLQDEQFRNEISKLVGEVCKDTRLSARINGYVNSKELDKEERKELRKDISKETYQTVRGILINQLREDKGYPDQARADAVTDLLIRLMGDISQSRGQVTAQRDIARHGRRDLSKAAKKDRKAQQEQAGDWEQEW